MNEHPLNAKLLRFQAGNSDILIQGDKTKILSHVSCFYSKCLAKIIFLLSASWLKSAVSNTIYYINTNEVPSELSRENFISSHVKITCYLHMWRDHCRYGNIKNLAFLTDVYIINRKLHAPLWIWILSSSVQHDISRVSATNQWDIELNTRR